MKRNAHTKEIQTLFNLAQDIETAARVAMKAAHAAETAARVAQACDAELTRAATLSGAAAVNFGHASAAADRAEQALYASSPEYRARCKRDRTVWLDQYHARQVNS